MTHDKDNDVDSIVDDVVVDEGNSKPFLQALSDFLPKENEFSYMPLMSNLPFRYLVEAVSAVHSNKVFAYRDRKNEVGKTKNINVTVGLNKEAKKASFTTKKLDEYVIKVGLSNIDALKNASESVIQVFVYFMTKLCTIPMDDNGNLEYHTVPIPFQNFITMGLYGETKRNSAVRFKRDIESIASLLLGGSVIDKKTGDEIGWEFTPLFNSIRMSKKDYIAYVTFNQDLGINWKFIRSIFTIIPEYYFFLEKNSALLLLDVFLRARNRNGFSRIARGEPFYLGMESVSEFMGLAGKKRYDDEGKIIGYEKNPTRQIRTPIVLAVEEINAMHKKHYHNDELSLRIVKRTGRGKKGNPVSMPEDASFKDFMNGRIEVRIKGKVAQYFKNLWKKFKEDYEKKKARRNRIIDRAKAINLAKKMEREEAMQTDS